MTIDDAERHNAKMAKKKAAREKIMATKTDEKGLLIVHTGKGKGKSSAAFGMIFRCIAHGFPCAVVQFIKGGMATGERTLITEHFGELCEFHTMGEGFTWETQDKTRDVEMAQAAWAKAKELIQDPQRQGRVDRNCRSRDRNGAGQTPVPQRRESSAWGRILNLSPLVLPYFSNEEADDGCTATDPCWGRHRAAASVDAPKRNRMLLYRPPRRAGRVGPKHLPDGRWAQLHGPMRNVSEQSCVARYRRGLPDRIGWISYYRSFVPLASGSPVKTDPVLLPETETL